MAEKQERQYAPDEINEFGEYIKIGGSPVPGITLRQVLHGHTDKINRIAWSPDGHYLASPSYDKTIRVWDVKNGECTAVLKHEEAVLFIAWSPNQELLASSYGNEPLGQGELRIWNVQMQQTILKSRQKFRSLAWSPDGEIFVLASQGGQLQLLDTKTWKFVGVLNGHADFVNDIVWSPVSNDFASASGIWEEHSVDKTIRIWDANSRKQKQILSGHSGGIYTIAWMPNSSFITSGSFDHTIRLWDSISGKQIQILEGHTDSITSLSFSSDATLLASRSLDNNIFLWRTDTWNKVAGYKEKASNNLVAGLAFNPHLPYLASLGDRDKIIRIWEIDYDFLIGNSSTDDAIRYTTAKIVLVGDSGVGKTGLGWRLAHNEFKEHSSTHGQQFWVIPELGIKREDDTECEAVLWDLAGQHIYRSIHSIFLDNVDASLVLFDPSNRQEPLKGAQFWLEQLKGKKQLPPTILVGARSDRGASALSQQELDQFCQKYEVSGGYVSTSAKSGEGLGHLLEILKEQIQWNQMTATVTTMTFKRIKEFVLALKQKSDRKDVFVKPSDLQLMLGATDEDWSFSDAEMRTAVGHLANHGYVTILHDSSGEEYILLVPELLASVASSIFLHADKHPRDLGAINEIELLQGKYFIDEFRELKKEEQQILLVSTVVRFLEHSICFRETYGNDNLLIFPSLIKQKRPLKDDVPATDDISYIVRGRVENIYSVLVVLLGYTPSFTRINQWQNQAQYETEKGNICGFRLIEEREGEIEFILYYGNSMSKQEREDFQKLFEHFLYQRDVEVTQFHPATCQNGHRQERTTVIKRTREGKNFLYCEECGAKTNLSNAAAKAIGIEASSWLQREGATARLRSNYEANLSRVRAYRQHWAAPRCYLSYLPDYVEFAEKLKHDLKEANVYIIEEPSKVQTDDIVIVLDGPAYQKSWKAQSLGEDIRLVKSRFDTNKLISLVLEGNPVQVHNFENCRLGDFCDETHYPVSLFNLILNLYVIPLGHTGFAPLRGSLHQQWEQTLAPKTNVLVPDETYNQLKQKTGREIFISYAWGGESEKLVNELDQAFRKRGVTIVRDKRDLDFKGRIKSFMDTIGKGKVVVLVISEKYLKSENCLFELLQIAKHGDLQGRIFPVVLEDARIYKAVDRIRYVQFWEQQLQELDNAMKTVSAINMHGFREDIDLYAEIRANLPKLTDILKDMNTLTPTIHRDADFQILFDGVMKKLQE